MLVGGRLLPDEGRAAAQFMYENAGGNRLTLCVRPARDDEDTAFHFVTNAGVSAFYWVDSPLAYAVTGKIGRDALPAISQTVYDQLREKPESRSTRPAAGIAFRRRFTPLKTVNGDGLACPSTGALYNRAEIPFCPAETKKP